MSGRRATASDASRTSAEPDATDSRQPQFGQLPWHGRPVDLDHHVPHLGAAADPAAVDLAAQQQPAADPGPEREQHDLGRALRDAERAPRTAMWQLASLSTTTGMPSRSAITSPNAMSLSGTLTAWTAIPVRESNVHGMPKPTASIGAPTAVRISSTASAIICTSSSW